MSPLINLWGEEEEIELLPTFMLPNSSVARVCEWAILPVAQSREVVRVLAELLVLFWNAEGVVKRQ